MALNVSVCVVGWAEKAFEVVYMKEERTMLYFLWGIRGFWEEERTGRKSTETNIDDGRPLKFYGELTFFW